MLNEESSLSVLGHKILLELDNILRFNKSSLAMISHKMFSPNLGYKGFPMANYLKKDNRFKNLLILAMNKGFLNR